MKLPRGRIEREASLQHWERDFAGNLTGDDALLFFSINILRIYHIISCDKFYAHVEIALTCSLRDNIIFAL